MRKCHVQLVALIFCATAALSIPAPATAQRACPDRYTVTDLGIIPGKSATVLYGTHTLNKEGQTAGFCNLGNIENGLYADLYLGNVAFVWTARDAMQQLPMLPGMTAANGWSLNNRKQVVGSSGNGPGDARPVLWEKGRVKALELLSGDNDGLAYAINDRGQIVGVSLRFEGSAYVDGRPVLWDKGRPRSLPFSPYPGGRCTAINDNGQIAGMVHTGLPGDLFFQSLPALWRDGCLTVLETLGGEFASAWDINERGQVVGFSQSADGAIRGCLWKDGVPSDPGGRGGTYTALWAINNKGQMVGESTDAGEVDHAILIDDGRVIDLNDRIPAGSGWVLLFATGINERGQISGTGFLDGQVRSFLLTPKDRR